MPPLSSRLSRASMLRRALYRRGYFEYEVQGTTLTCIRMSYVVMNINADRRPNLMQAVDSNARTSKVAYSSMSKALVTSSCAHFWSSSFRIAQISRIHSSLSVLCISGESSAEVLLYILVRVIDRHCQFSSLPSSGAIRTDLASTYAFISPMIPAISSLLFATCWYLFYLASPLDRRYSAVHAR